MLKVQKICWFTWIPEVIKDLEGPTLYVGFWAITYCK